MDEDGKAKLEIFMVNSIIIRIKVSETKIGQLHAIQLSMAHTFTFLQKLVTLRKTMQKRLSEYCISKLS